MFKKFPLTVFGLILCVNLLTNCGKVDVKNEVTQLSGPVPLIDAYSSLMTIEQVRKGFGVSPAELERILLPVAGKSPRGNQSQIMRQWFEADRENALLGFSGKVRFEFYHDRLARIVFFPEDVGEFLMSTLQVKVKPNQYGAVPTTTPHLQIAYGSSHVVWMDKRILSILERAD